MVVVERVLICNGISFHVFAPQEKNSFWRILSFALECPSYYVYIVPHITNSSTFFYDILNLFRETIIVGLSHKAKFLYEEIRHSEHKITVVLLKLPQETMFSIESQLYTLNPKCKP